MKRYIGALLLGFLSHMAYSQEHVATFMMTSECVSSVEVKASNYFPGWDLKITLQDVAASDLHEFSSDRMGKKILLIDGNGNQVLRGGAVVREPLPSPFVISGIQTEEEATKARIGILSSSGPCGVGGTR
jgi:hypothetical protein